MNFGWNVETLMLAGGSLASGIGTIYVMKSNWRQYGKLYLAAAITGNIICFIFMKLDFYSYPYTLFPKLYPMPFALLLTMFPFYVVFGVRYSPSSWKYKIPFYWVAVHIGVLGEITAVNLTRIIRYERYWDSWDSYTWWWLFLLVFDAVGGVIVSKEYRKPIDEETFRYGRAGWFIVHFILISTIFIAGVYLGTKI